ncbi:MAG: hypothetical protein AB6733_17770 [Clostridiaceae bacterium]
MRNLIFNYLVYVVYFLGMGLVSSGIVLMPFNITRYSAILITGLVLFISGSIFNEIVINKHKLSFSQIVKLTIVTLTLAIGIGMISGGISHFKESPTYVSYLIPLGIVISLISFSIKNNYKLETNKRVSLVVIIVIVAIVLHFILRIMGAGITGTGGDIFNNTNNMNNTNDMGNMHN